MKFIFFVVAVENSKFNSAKTRTAHSKRGFMHLLSKIHQIQFKALETIEIQQVCENDLRAFKVKIEHFLVSTEFRPLRMHGG